MTAATPRPTSQRMASTWFLGMVVAGAVVFAWTRGMGRLLLPVLVIGGVLLVVARVVKALRAPVD